MEKKKHRSTKKAKEKADTKIVEAPSIQPDHKVEHSGSGLTEALRHQDELVQGKIDEKV